MEPVFELPLTVPPRSSGDRLRSLHGQLRAAILEGRLQPGLRLPSTRAFAQAQGVSRNTAMAAYEASYAASHGGAAFNPSSSGLITDPTVLAAANAVWHLS